MLFLRVKMHTNAFSAGLRPVPAAGASSAFPDPLAGLRGGKGEGRDWKGGNRQGGSRGAE